MAIGAAVGHRPWGSGIASKAGLGLLLAFGSSLPGSVTQAQSQTHGKSSKTSTPAERTVFGSVVDSGGKPVDGAVVYLQNTKSMVIRSYVANNGGHYHFNQISPDTDYDVWAEVNKHRSKTHTVSMFSSHLRFPFTLKIKA